MVKQKIIYKFVLFILVLCFCSLSVLSSGSISTGNINPISNWIIGSDNNMLVLIGDRKISNIVSDRIIMNLFDNGVSGILTENILEKNSIEEIIQGKIFLIVKIMPIKERV